VTVRIGLHGGYPMRLLFFRSVLMFCCSALLVWQKRIENKVTFFRKGEDVR